MLARKHAVAPKVIVQFLNRTLPFSGLDREVLEEVAQQWRIDYYPKGTVIFEQDVTEVTHLYLIQKGGVKVYFRGAGTVVSLKDFRGEGASFGALSIVRGQKPTLTVEAAEDTFCFLLAKEAFLRLVQQDSKIAQFFLQGFSEEFMEAAYSQLRNEKVRFRKEESLYLFNTGVRNIVKAGPETIPSSSTIRQAAARMSELRIGSVLVRDAAGNLVGIVTDKDLRTKVIALGLDYDISVEAIMSSPVSAISSHALCFDALLQIMQQEVNHLVVKDDDTILGVLTSQDIMVYKGAWPIYLFREILEERQTAGLYTLAQKVPFAVRTLIEEGAKAENISRVITMLNDSIFTRLLDEVVEALGPPPVPFCWLKLGSDGRKEQTLRTDQDNALIYDPPGDSRDPSTVEAYFDALAMRACLHLETSGYPKCKGGLMTNNRRWCKPVQVWQRYFDDWIATPDPKEAALASVFFDFRSGYGTSALAEELRSRITEQVQCQPTFLMHLAGDCLVQRPPLSFFRDLVVERTGEYTKRLDMKRRCVNPFVGFARVMALRHGIEETNTLLRLQALAEHGHIPIDFYAETREAYEFVIQLRLVHQLKMQESGIKPHSWVDPVDLTDLERKTLKEAFAVIERMLARLKKEFPAVL